MVATAAAATQRRLFTLAADETTAIEVAAGEVFRLALEANLSTGYCWRLDQPLDPEQLELLGSTDEEATAQRLGAPQRQIWTLRAKRPGVAEITLAYARPWEKEAPPLRRHRVVMTIR